MPTSFRKGSQPLPSRYRTPSPPKDAVEPLSPTTLEITPDERSNLQWIDNREDRKHLKRPYLTRRERTNGSRNQKTISQGVIDTFAAIALSTAPNIQQTSEIFTSLHPIDDQDDRPSKRAKSEKLASPEWPKNGNLIDTRPATSHEHFPEDRRLEAELLLNFAQANFAQAAVQFKSPSPATSNNIDFNPQSIPETMNDAMPDDKAQGWKRDDQVCGKEIYQEKSEMMRETDAKTCLETKAVSNNEFFSTNVSRGQHLGDAPSMATETAIMCRENDERYRVDPATAIPDVPEYEHVDLIPEPLRSFQEEIAEQKQLLGTSETCERPGSPSPDTNSKFGCEAILDKHVTRTMTPKPLSNTPPTTDDIFQVNGGIAKSLNNSVDMLKPRNLQLHPQSDPRNDSRTVHGTLSKASLEAESLKELEKNQVTFAPKTQSCLGNDSDESQSQSAIPSAICAACKFARNFKGIESEGDSTSWISCDACKAWFHFACAGFKNEREVRGVDKFRCRKCKPIHGATTFVRKSSRAHSAIDYAGLHQGFIKTSDERPEHHYIKPIKDGTIAFLPENFARMRPELTTAEYFQKGVGMKEPIIIPAGFNPQKGSEMLRTEEEGQDGGPALATSSEDDDFAQDWFSRHPECDSVLDCGQDSLDMVIPRGLTVRQVAELYGNDEKVEVIDVKSQNGENKKWNMKRWADYYENPSNKVVRNVISLEVSQSKLGRLIRRPQIVRELDLQDSVWPDDLLAKGEYPRVQFYCLMSVADCFTDFHIDFGGSSVFYHILKGKKTFLFIPPKEKHLKKYEEWCMSPAQNWTFLGDQTKECYRVDLSQGDTMLIPSGWIHAVWTPEDSLVIGGNFLTRMNYAMQLRVAQVEKATGVARKFRYPHFQKLHWYTALNYLETDPLPNNVRDMLHSGGSFDREMPSYYDFDAWGENSRSQPENYHAKYYSQPELEGLPDLTRYLLRTALIDIGSITDGISADTRNAVKKSIPRGHGEPLDVIKTFAAWCAWKRGNEPIPHWAYPDAVPENLSPDKLSAAAMKKLDREAALSAPRRQSARMQSQQDVPEKIPSESQIPSALFSVPNLGDIGQTSSDLTSSTPRRSRVGSGTGSGSHRKTACESCRKRRRACKHKDQVAASIATSGDSVSGIGFTGLSKDTSNATVLQNDPSSAVLCQLDTKTFGKLSPTGNTRCVGVNPEHSPTSHSNTHASTQLSNGVAVQPNSMPSEKIPEIPMIDLRMSGDAIKGLEPVLGNAMQVRPRHKACTDCRKSKVGFTVPYLPICRLTLFAATLYS